MEDLNKVYKRSPDVVFRRIGNECVLVPIRQNAADLNSVYTLNAVSAFIWELLNGKKSLLHISNDLVSVFDVDEKTAQEDLLIFAEKLSKEGAIELLKEV